MIMKYEESRYNETSITQYGRIFCELSSFNLVHFLNIFSNGRHLKMREFVYVAMTFPELFYCKLPVYL